MRKKYAQSTHRKDCSRCAGFLRAYRTLHQFSRIALRQLSKDSRMWSSSKTTSCYMKQQRIKTRTDCLQSLVGYVKKFHHQWEEIQLKTSFKRKFSRLLCFRRLLCKEGKAPNPKHVDENQKCKFATKYETTRVLCRLSKIYGRMIPDFATKMLHLNEPKRRIQMRKGRAKCFWNQQ